MNRSQLSFSINANEQDIWAGIFRDTHIGEYRPLWVLTMGLTQWNLTQALRKEFK